MKKTVYTVCVDNYFPELTRYTLPNIAKFAARIGAGFQVIRDRKYLDFPPTYEKMQVHELGRDNDWNILIDADCMVSPKLPDPTLMPPEIVAFYMEFDASLLFEADEYFLRDGRKLGVSTNFVVSSRMCHDLWAPLEFSAEVAKTKTQRWFIVDEYCVSRNLARYGLKRTGTMGEEDNSLFRHFDVTTLNIDRNQIVEEAKRLSEEWHGIS